MNQNHQKPVIAIAGAGSIGCFVGGLIAAAGGDVRFLARPRIAEMLLAHGLRVTDYTGMDKHVSADVLKISTDPTIFADADIILVTVKSGATQEMASLIKAHAPASAKIVSLQNGVGNGDVLRAGLPGRDVRDGIVAYNVVNAGEGRFHRGTGGIITIGAGADAVVESLRTPNLAVEESDDIKAVQWGKLLINLNNALNALSGQTLINELTNQGWRRILAEQIQEGLKGLAAQGIVPKSPVALPIGLLPHIMKLPTPIYRLVAGPSLKIDPEARSSMWEDLQQGRKTEINELQGAVVRLCEEHGLGAPMNARILGLIGEAEKNKAGSPGLTPAQVRATPN